MSDGLICVAERLASRGPCGRPDPMSLGLSPRRRLLRQMECYSPFMTYVPYVRFSRGAAVLAAVAGATAVVAVAGPASAASCASPVRYVSSTNTIYLTGGGSFTPTQIVAACPDAPLKLVDSSSRTWELDADLVVQEGSTLTLAGKAAGGDVDNLRIRSLASNKATEVQQIAALYGTIDIESVNISSWDTAAGGPDTNEKLSSSPQSTDRGRAFIRAISTYAADGKTVLASRMNIRNSKLSYLGYFGGEAYGVAYKARGCDRDHISACKKMRVRGEQLNSTFDHNYMGTYTWGAYGITFRGNTYSNNVAYGLDPHDGSSNLIIDKNRFTYNGNHGLICSQLCTKLTITNNISDHNGVRPSGATAADDDADGQVHGIMLHRGVTNSVISGNMVTDQVRGAGIAIFDSTNNKVSNNTLINNAYGIRLSVGTAKNTFKSNTITDSIQNAVYMYKGTDTAIYSTKSGRPTSNTFDGNTISKTGSYGLRIVDADKNTFKGSSMDKLGATLLFQRAIGNVLGPVGLPAKQPIAVSGTTDVHSTLTLKVKKDAVSVTVDKYSKVSYK